jgi:alkylation response protein AidB-like acyl-CoA dehydrogenase
MEFSWSNEEENFRLEVREFLDEHWDAGMLPEGPNVDNDAAKNYVRNFKRKLAEKGWLTMSWPEEYGGQGASYVQQMIFREEGAIVDEWNRRTKKRIFSSYDYRRSFMVSGLFRTRSWL